MAKVQKSKTEQAPVEQPKELALSIEETIKLRDKLAGDALKSNLLLYLDDMQLRKIRAGNLSIVAELVYKLSNACLEARQRVSMP